MFQDSEFLSSLSSGEFSSMPSGKLFLYLKEAMHFSQETRESIDVVFTLGEWGDFPQAVRSRSLVL
jgi:hypothetical protein